MSGRQATLVWGFVLSIVILLLATVSTGQTRSSRTAKAAADTAADTGVEKLLPAKAVAYLGWGGTDVHQNAWKATAAYQSLYETGVADSVRKLVEFVLQQSGTNTGEVMPVIDHLSQKGVSLAIVIPETGPPLPQVTVAIRQGKSLLPALDAFMQRSIGGDVKVETRTEGGRNIKFVLVPNSPGIEFGWWADGPHLVLAGGIGVVDAAISVAEGSTPNITTHPLWAGSHKSETGEVISLVSWIDFAALREIYGGMPVQNPNPNGPPLSVQRIIDALGLSKLGPLVFRSGYAGPAMWSETTLAAPEPRTGLLAPWSYGTLKLEDLPPLPAGGSGFFARSVDWTKMHDETVGLLENIAELGPPEAADQLDRAFEDASNALGIDVQRDLFAPLGNTVCFYADPLQGLMGFGAVLAIQVKDAETLRETVADLFLRLSGASRGQITTRSVSKYDREMLVVQFAQVPFSPAVCVDEKWLAIGLTAQSVESFLLRLDGKLPKWEPSEEHAAGLKLAQGEVTGLSVTDPRETVKALLGAAPMLLSFASMAMNEQALRGGPAPVLPINAEDIPPTEVVTAPLFPNVSVCTTDAEGIRWRSRTSVPSIPLTTSIGGGSSVAVTGTLVALLLPAVQQSRAAARRLQSKNNLKQIGLAMHNYHDVHLHFPQGTVPNDDLEVEKRLSWMVEILPFIDQAAVFNGIDREKAWDDDANAAMSELMLPVFINPNEPIAEPAGKTTYVGLAGVGEDGPKLPADDKRAGVFAYDRATKIGKITDGTSNTVAVSESRGQDDRWAAGGKSTIRPLTQKPYINGPDGLGSSFPGGCHMLFCDGSVRFISENIDPTMMEHLTTIAGGEVIGDF